MPYDKIDQLYDALKKDGAVSKSREHFRNKMLAPGKEGYQNRLQLYNALKADGAVDSQTYEEFRNRLGLHAVNAGGRPMTKAEKQQMMGNVTGLVENAKAGVAGAQKRIANQMAIVKKPLNVSSRIGENKNVREKGYSYNPNSGKLEKAYVTTLGNEYDNRYNADQEQKQIDRLNHDSSLGGQLENAYAERERLDEALKKRRQEVDQSEGKLARFLRGFAANSSAGNGAVAYQEQDMRYNNDPEYLQLMAAARKNHQTIQLLEQKRDNKMNEFWRPALDDMTGGSLFTSGLAGLQDLIAQQEAEKHLDSINKKRAKGKKLTRDEQAAEVVLKNFATNDAMQALYGDDYGPWGRAGKTLATGLDFMYDIGISGDLGGIVTKGVSKAVVNGASKGLTKLAGKQAEKLLAKKAMQYTLKATGVGIGAHLGGLAIANTTAVGKTVGQLGTATSGHVVADDKGSYHVVDKQKLLPALAEVERSQAREYGSEMIGEFLPGGKILKKGLEKIGLSKVASTFTNIGTKQWYKQYSNLLKAGGYNGIPGEVMEEYEGSLFDALTGHADDAWRDMTSLRNHVDIWLGCGTMGAIMGAVPMMGAVNHTANYYGYKHKTDKADKVASSLVGDEKWGAIRDKIDQTENGKMTDVLVGILMDKELNDNAKNATLDYVRNLTMMRGYNIANVNCAAEESMEATPTDQHEGEAAQQQDRKNGAKNITESMNASYGMGYNATDTPSMYDAGVTLKAQENRLSKLLGVDDVRKAMGEDPMAFVEKRKQAGASAEELQAMEDFLVADSAVKGIRQRMADKLDSRLSESDAEMGKRINTEDGMVHKAVMQVRNQDGKEHEVYVLKGNVRMNADGRGVDASSSDNEIYVYDPQEGKTRMMPPSFIERIDEPVDAETVRRAAGESIRQDYQSELGKLDTSGLSFQVGDRYDAVDERGVQHRIEVVGGAVDDAGNAMNGYVGVRVDGGEAVSMRTDEIAKMVGNADVQRREAELSGEAGEEGHAVDTEDASDADHAVDADDVPTYAQNEVLTLLDEHGNPVRAEITAAANEDGLYEVQTDEPIDGKRVSMMSAEEIAAKAPLNPPGRVENEPTKDLQGQEDDTTLEAGESGDVDSALSRIPMDEETQEPRYEEVDADTAWDAIVEQTNGDRALAQEVVDDTVNEMSSGIEKAEKAISKATFKGKGIQERIAFAKDKQERMAALDLEKERLAKWKRIASVERMRAAAVEAEKSKAAAAERKARQEEEEKARLAREEAERKEREALNGVPNMTEDKPSDARARGYRRVDGHKVDRQAPVKAVKGKEVQVKFDDKNIPAGHVAIVDASELQPSHIGGQRNAKHFIDEAQPKERKDDASVEAARKIASNIRPEEITSSVTAYTGAPTVNSRGEVIQGNNRSAALKEMWASHPEQGARYKQYLKEHAAEYGLTAEDIDKVQSPVLVNMLDVSDADAIALGQFVASDTESGGTERLKPKNITKKLGTRMKNFSNILLRSSDEESSFSELLDRNGVEALKWLNGIGAITPTQYKSSFDSKGHLTAEAKNDLKGVLYQYVFEGGSTQLEEMFNGLPAKAQRAILSTAYRDYESAQDERMTEEIQDSIMAYHALSQDAQFMSATNHKDARAAVESWKRQYAIDDATGESYLPSEKFSNFALLLAVMYKGDTQSYIQAKFNAMYDLIQGVREGTLFGTPDNTPRTLVEAIKEILNIDYDGRQRSDVLVGGNQVGQARGTGSPTGAERGERGTQGAEAAERGRRAAESSSRRGVEERQEASGETVVSQAGEPLSEKKNSVSDNTTDTVGTAESGKRNDTATPQNTVSDGKDSKVSDTKQENLSENDRANLAELSDFAVNTDSAKRTTVDAAGFDSENLTVSLLIDGKPSRLSVATIVPDVITDRSYQTAVYDYSDDIDNKTNSGWQKWEDLSDEYNSKVSEEERASVFGDSAELHFKTVDAAVKFDDWLRSGRIEKQQRADELRNDTAAKQLATNAVLDALDNAGISVEVVSDEVASEMLGRNEAKAESNNKEDLGTTDHVQFMRMGGKKKSTPETASPDNQDQPTVVSSADGANILKSLDSEIKKYENVSSYPKTFIGDVSKALGAKRQGSASEYASFETKSGKTVTIRLSNHNAKVSTFDAHDEAEGISIVVTPKENKGISNDGNAHVTEFYYNAIKLRRAEGKPLVEILKSIKQALYSGAYTDNTGLAEVKEVNVPTASDGQTDSGKVYGWTADGKIFLTKDGINPNTPIHEYTHLWAGAMRQRNEKGWQRVKNLLKGTPIWDEVLNDPNYRAISADEDAVASEALSRISGRENAKKMEAEAQRMIDEADGIAEKAEAVSLLDHMRRALDAFWRWIGKNLFGIKKFESIEEVTDRVLYDLTTGTDLQNDRSLMAVHNISVDKLESSLELGGFPMPSIAITNANMGHAGYGEISLVLGKESVDPSDSRNKVYSGDAWTPTFPQIGYKLNDKKTNEIYKRANEVGSLPLFNPVYFHPDNYEGKIDRRGDASLVDHFKEDYGAKQMYLAERGNAVRAFVQHEVQKYSPEKVSLYKKILETIGLERLKNDNLDSVKSDLTALGVNGKSPKYYERIILCAIDYAEHGNSKIENDIDATKQEIDKRIDGKSFSAWLENLFDGVVEKKGIRNERDMFTPSGSSRKWESLYDAVTLDNVIKSMQQQSKKGGSGLFNSSIFGASTKELPSIDAIRREAKLRINSIPNEKIEKAKGRIIERLEKVSIPSVEKGVADAFDFVENVINAVSASHSPSGIYKYLRTYYPDMTMDAAKEISDIVGDIQKMSTKYFEAKPYRAVGFDEVRAAVVPNDVPQEIIDGLRERGVKVVSYEKGNEQERKDALSSVTHEMDIRFQIKGKDEPSAEKSERNHAADEVVNELDKRYMEAVKRGDMATAQRMVNEAARRSGYFPGSNYQGTSAFNGSAPYGNGYFITPEERKEAFENDEFDGDTTLADYVTGGIDPMNLDFLLSENNYRHSDVARKEAIDNIREVVRTKGQRVTMYRSVPSSVKEGSFRNGDWVTPSRKYAEENARVHGWGNAYRIIEQDVPISEVWFDGNDIAEWGYGSEGDFLNDKDYLYGNTLNNRKLPDAVIYDDNGDVIPLSKRFDTMSGDLRFRTDKNFENPNVSDGNVLRERHGVNGDEDISLSHDPMGKLLGESVYTDAQRKAFGERERKRMAVHVSELAEKLNLKNVDVVTDASTLSGDRRRAKGFFNKKTGKITIVIPNHTDMADVEKTLLHEAVAHHGLRKLFGENFHNFLDNVYRNAEYDIRKRISEMSSHHGWDVRTATEEYLAGLAEDTNFENMPDGFWSKIKRFFLQMLHSIGFKNLTDVSMGNNELRYVLWRSYENLKEPGRYRNFFAEAADVAKQHQLKVGPYEVSDRADKANVADRADKANEANRADRADTDDELYRSGVERTVERVPDIVVSQLYEDAVKDTRDRTLLGALVRTWSKDGRTRFKNKFAESYFDYSRSVKALQDAIAEATGRKVEWFEDVWKSLNAKSSIDEREQEVMSRTLAVPLSRHISSMVSLSGGKYDLDAIEAYLNAKHGLERNELMARRAAEEAAEEAYGAEIAKCRKALAADALDTTAEERLQELTSQYDAMVEESYAANRRDYAGLTALFDPEKEGKSLEELEDAARKYISEIEGYYDADTVGGLWDKVRALNNFSLQKSYESGLLSKKQYDDVNKMYKWYVPLRGWHDNYAGDVYNYVNRGADRGMIENAVKKAYGRTSRAGNILGTMSAMANSAIVVGNKNKVAQVFMNLALNHEDTGMFTISEAWYEKNEADDSWRIVTPDNRIHEGMTAEEVADTITKWEDEMREKAANGKALMRSGKFAKDFRHNLEAWKEQQHCVRVSRGGKEYLVYVNGNPRATQAINGLLNPDYQPGIAENLLQKYMRHLARVQTSWSLKFVMSNVQRDVLTATGSAYAKNGAGYALQFEQNFAMNSKDIFGLFYKDLHGSLDMGNAKERMFKEFLDNGGKTGISAIGKKQEYEEKYNKSIRRAMHPASSAVMQGAEGIVQGVEFMNSCIENLTRFSTYMTSRQMGKSIKDAIFDAKECSVNFNMKGSGAWGNATLRKYILYTNPALQALRMLNSWYEANNVRTVGMLASGVALGFTVAMVNAMCNGGDGDDNAYYGLSDYNRYTYFNIGIGNRKFLHWRLPQEMSPLYALGHISYDLMTERISTERAIQMSLEQLNNYSPLSLIEGNPNYDQSADNTYAKTFLKAITPSYLSPFTDAFLWDEDFLGRSIGNRNEWNKRKPEWQRVDKRTPEWFIKPFEAIGKATGSNGSDRKGLTNSPVFNPSAWWFVLMQQGGGLAQVGEQAFNACAVVLGSKDADDMELKDYPLVSTVLVDAGTDNARMRIKNERFWMYRSEYEANKATISNITHARDLSPVEKAEKISSMQDSRYALMDYFMKKYYKPLREGIAEAEANKDKAETKRLKGMLNEVKGMLLERIEEASSEASPSPSKGGEKAPL